MTFKIYDSPSIFFLFVFKQYLQFRNGFVLGLGNEEEREKDTNKSYKRTA